MLQLKSLVDGMFADPLPAEPPDQDVSVEEMVDKIIDESIAAVSTSPQSMTKDERVKAVRAMNNRGLFLIRSSVETAAARLGVTRYTIYNYLDQEK
ncbi:MAG: helix-turn-helix domain-containing protein [Burkholderiaceae bacterium]